MDKMTAANKENRPEGILNRIRNNKIVSILIVTGVIITSLATFTDSFEKLWSKCANLFTDKGFRIEGDIVYEPGAQPAENILVTIIWGLDRSEKEGGDTQFQSSVIAKVKSDEGRLNYSLVLTKDPPEELLMDFDSIKLGVGYIVAFNDKNNNGLLDLDEKILGGSANYCVTFLNGDLKTWAETKGKGKLYTLLKLKQGYCLTKTVPPEVHKFPVPFDDLVPIDLIPVNIVIPRDTNNIKFPNWT